MTTEPTAPHGRRTAVVTGAANGMGHSTVQLLRQSGWDVVAFDRASMEESAPADAAGSDPADAHAGASTSTGTEAASGLGVLRTAVVDICDRGAVETALESILDPESTLELVANVAGVYPPTTLDTFTEELYRRTFDVNVLGSLNVIAAAQSRLSRGAAVVNFASVDAFTVSPGQLLYGASKAAVVMLTKELALELAPAGIRVNAIAPGWVDTPGNAATGRMAMASQSVPLGRVAAPHEIARWVEILASEDCAFMTGETIVLSGGDVMR